MKQLFAPSLFVSAATKISKIRELPIPGEILIAVGDIVKPHDIVGRVSIPGDLKIVRAAEDLDTEPKNISRYLKVSVGATVKKGELLAEQKGLWGMFSTRISSSVHGTLEFITESTGHLGIRQAPRRVEIKAYIGGKVTRVVAGKSLTIETNGALVQGIFGIGGEQIGKITLLKVPNDRNLTPDLVPDDSKGSILIGGTNPSLEFLRKAEMSGVVGIVTGSIETHVLTGYLGFDLGVAVTGNEKIPLSLIVTEGFGSLPISEHIEKALAPVDGRTGSLNGATQVRAGAMRPEIVVSRDDTALEASAPQLEKSLDIGTTVRLTRFPYFGKFGIIKELPAKPERIDTGAEVRVARVEIENQVTVTVPRANLEVS